MQVGNSVNGGYHAQYHSRSSAKKSADTLAFESTYAANETVGNQRSRETVDYQEYYKAWISHGNSRVIECESSNANVSSMEPTGAVSISETEDEGEFLGLTMVPEDGQSVTYGMRAMLSDKSTPDNPIVQVVSNLGGKKVIYNVEVNKVNPNHATQLEMFALLSYTDKMGITDGGAFGSHQQLEVYGGNASSIGYCGSLSGAEVFLNERFDWTFIMEKMVQVYQDAGIENQAEVIKYREQEKEFYRSFIDKLENIEKTSDVMEEPQELSPELLTILERISFEELGEDRVGAMRLTHGIKQIVTAKDPEDGKEYLTYFTDKSIVCQNEEGTIVWTMSITESQAALVKEYFEGYEANHGEEPAWYSDESLGIVSSEKFWMGFFEGASIGGSSEIMQKPADDSLEETTDYYEFLRQKIEEIFIKIQNGDTEPTYQIGAQSFTEKEWEEFLDKFDTIEEAIQELMKEEQARKEAEEEKKEGMVTNDASTLLTTESTSCVYETADPEDDDLRYITWYTEEGIFCRKAGQTEGYEWAITFENKEQYDKVMEFIGQFPSDWNMRFAAHENFWNDFLNDEIDMDGFMEFIGGTNKGVPDYSITVGDSIYIDKDKMQWAKYTNPLGTRFYTAEEMHQMRMGITEEEEQQKREEWRKQMGYPEY